MYSFVFAHLADRDLISGALPVGIYLWRVNHYITLVNLQWHPSALGAWCWCCSHIFWPCASPPFFAKLKVIGLEQHVLQWLASYLTDRQQHTVVDSATYNASPVLSGVPQGLILGLLCTSTVCPLCHYLRDQRYQYMQATFFSASRSTILITMMMGREILMQSRNALASVIWHLIPQNANT